MPKQMTSRPVTDMIRNYRWKRTIIVFLLVLAVLIPSALSAGTTTGANPSKEVSAGTTTGELHAAPVNPEFVAYMNEKTHKAQVLSGNRYLGEIPSPIYRPDVKDVQMFGSTKGDRATSYPAKYDLRDYNKVSPVKNQNPWGTCWAFATMASLESTGMSATLTPSYSEKNLVNLAGFDGVPQDVGGSIVKSMAYLARWNGPVDEVTDPYPSASWSSSSIYPPVKHVQNVVSFPGRSSRTDTGNLKGALTGWGAVYSSLWWYDTFYNETYTSYYQPASDSGASSGHAVTIVGWDDTYAATNFTNTADGPGAWIVKNSWGSSWGSNGYFYVSYYDKSFGSAIYNTYGNYKDTAVFLGESTSNYNTVYSYDRLGDVGDFYYGTAKTGSFANVFTANSSETIKAVGFYTTDVNVPYNISIYKNPTSGPIGGTPAATISGNLPYMGYNTVVIPSAQQVALTAGDRFSVVVQVANPTNSYYIPVEYNSAGYTSNITSQAGQCYALGSSGWVDWKSYWDNSHICIKAYTSSTVPVSRNTTIGMYRGGMYYLRNSNTAGNADLAFAYGSTGDIPVTGDWNGDGITTIGMYRGGTYYLRNSNTAGDADITFAYGSTGDLPVTGDWTGKGYTSIGMYRGGTYYLRNSNTAGNADISFAYGSTGDIPVTGDWTGKGYTSIGMYRGGTYYLRNSNTAGNADISFAYGSTGDIPVTGDWTSKGYTSIGMYRGGTYYLRNSNTAGDADITFAYGSTGDIPVTGKWV